MNEICNVQTLASYSNLRFQKCTYCTCVHIDCPHTCNLTVFISLYFPWRFIYFDEYCYVFQMHSMYTIQLDQLMSSQNALPLTF
jgi:hypothetical protein